ncbi:MAG: hypothetical protein LBE16_01915 [Clostridiales Family XIII bacterium]|nr:hypothetical protein [Clostridiales Family XIII bacterium]
MRGIRVLLALSYDDAAALHPTASVEAEYGDHTAAGSLVTLAHHGQNSENPAPCVAEVCPLPDGASILVSHIDLDTVGGCLALMGCKPAHDAFREAAAYIDVAGAHCVHALDAWQRDALNAVWAWKASLPRENFSELTDVTDRILEWRPVLAEIIGGDLARIETGKRWAAEIAAKVERCVVLDTPQVRGFITDAVFCASSYYSPAGGYIAKATATLDKGKRSVVIAFADGGAERSALALAQKLWGRQAGGRPGIAGSPRAWDISESALQIQFDRACRALAQPEERSV